MFNYSLIHSLQWNHFPFPHSFLAQIVSFSGNERIESINIEQGGGSVFLFSFPPLTNDGAELRT